MHKVIYYKDKTHTSVLTQNYSSLFQVCTPVYRAVSFDWGAAEEHPHSAAVVLMLLIISHIIAINNLERVTLFIFTLEYLTETQWREWLPNEICYRNQIIAPSRQISFFLESKAWWTSCLESKETLLTGFSSHSTVDPSLPGKPAASAAWASAFGRTEIVNDQQINQSTFGHHKWQVILLRKESRPCLLKGLLEKDCCLAFWHLR